MKTIKNTTINHIIVISAILLVVLISLFLFLHFSLGKNLHRAIYNNDLGLVKKLIKEGAELNKPVLDDMPTWEWGLSSEFPYFYIRKDNIIRHGHFPLALAVRNYRWKTDHGEKPDAESIKALKIIKALLEAGADPNLFYELSSPPISPPAYPICEADFHKDAVELLIKHGANVDFRTDYIDVDYPYNGSYYIDDLVDFLTHVNCKLTDKEKYELIKKAVDASKKLNERPGAYLLYILQRNFLNGKIYYEIFKYLIEEKKVDPNIKFDDRSMLHFLAGCGAEDDLKAIKLLLKHGADINILDNLGKKTPLEYIPSEDKDSIKFMRSLGAKTSKELKAESKKKSAPDKPTK